MKLSFFLPKQTDFYQLLNQLVKHVGAISSLYKEFVTVEKNWTERDKFTGQAKEIEHAADEVTHQIIDKLNRTFVTPLDREDIYALTHELDDIIDQIENVVHNVKVYNLVRKKDLLIDFSKLFEKGSRDLATLVGSLYQQKFTPEIKKLVINLHDLEDEGDTIFVRSVSSLFQNGEDPITVIRWKDIIEDLERVADKFQDVSNTIEGILVKSQ